MHILLLFPHNNPWRRNSTLKLLLFSLLFLFATAGCREVEQNKEGNLAESQPARVGIFKVRVEEIRNQVEIMGTVQAAKKAIIAAKIDGHITHLPIKLGSRVKKGDRLVQISAGEISAQLLQATAQLHQAERNLLREQKLLKQDAATSEGVKTQEDDYKIAQASYKEAQTMLSYTTPTAPFDGIITQKLVNIGDLATLGKPLLHLENEKHLQILTDIPEIMVLKMRLGDTLTVSAPAANTTLHGTVTEIAPAADPLSRSATVIITLPAAPNLRSGQFARVFLTESTAKAIMVPVEAILPFGQIERVFIVKEGKARLQLVRTGKKTHDEKIEILSGLAAGDSLIYQGHTTLVEGQKISHR